MTAVKTLTTKEVARLCCVSDATVKRWEDGGLIESERTSGGHRRFHVAEIAKFQREQGLGLRKSNGDEPLDSTNYRRREAKHLSDCEFFNALVSGNEELASSLLIAECLNNNPIERLIDELISPSLNRIGELWIEDKLTIAQEHLATRTILSAIHRLRCLMPIREPNGIPAVCCTIEGDFHELPAHFAQMIFENAGFEVINFGANMPVYALCDEILQYGPKLICISSTVLNDIDRLTRDYKSFSEKLCRHNATVILGGRGFEDPQVRNRFPAEYFAESFTNLAEIVRQIPFGQ